MTISVMGGGWANVWVNGEKQPKSAPLTLELNPGTYQIKVQNPAIGVDQTESVTVTSGGTAKVTAKPQFQGAIEHKIPPTVTVEGDPIILGALDRSLIDEVVQRHMNQIRYCYEREWSDDKSLAGKIVIKFVVQKDGTVSSASTKSTTMNNTLVESCIEDRFMRMQFQNPKGGGIVIVSYPLLFSPD